jgi:single-strand DNA-binding protein
MNNVNLVGILAEDPELRYTQSNKAYVRVAVGVRRNISKEQKEAGAKDIDWISCIFWDTNAENLAKYIKKSGLIAITGKLVTGSYESQDGTTRYTTDVRVYQLTFLNNKPKDERPEPEYDGYEPAETEQNVKENDPFADFGESVEISDDDLPF